MDLNFKNEQEVLSRKASRRVSGHGLLKCLHFKRSEPESRVAISTQGKLTTSFSDSTSCEITVGEIDFGFLERYT
jgi:dTDP-4-dehydrorhamnose 3,5-epimerase-like enzyme